MQVFNGSIVAIVTPMMADGQVDYASLENLIDWHIASGTNGIVSVGTTGESSTLEIQEHLNVIKHTIDYSNSRIPIIAGTGGNSTKEAIDLTVESKILGADGALLVTPYYNKPSQVGLIKHYEAVADAVDIPQILYNVPTRTACDLEVASTSVLANHKNIVGIKEAHDDPYRIKELIKISNNTNDFIVLSGDDPTFFDSMLAGSHGVISVAANIFPKEVSSICRNVLDGNVNEAEKTEPFIIKFL
jgi:4-hydroxy-tetrahydrodipicolinate synthase